MTIHVIPLHPALGAEIRGDDLRQPQDAATIKAISDALDQHVVVMFRGQDISEPDQIQAAECFGKVAYRRRPVNGVGPGGDYDTPFMMVTNIIRDGKSIGAFGDGFKPLRSMGATKRDDAKPGEEVLFGMGPFLKNQIAERRCRRSNQTRIGTDTFDGPTRIAPVAGWHVFANGCVLVIAAGAQVRRDPLAPERHNSVPQ